MSALRKESIRQYERQYDKESFNQQVVKKKRIKKKQSNKIIIDHIKHFSMAASIFVFMVSIIYNYSVITQKKSELRSINNEIKQINDEIILYSVTLENLKNTNRIEDIAKTYLGMNYPNSEQAVVVEFKPQQEEKLNDDTSKDKSILNEFIDKIVDFVR